VPHTSNAHQPRDAIGTQPGAPAVESTDTDALAPSTAADKVRHALRQHPGATAAELAIAAGVGKSTAGKVLATFASDRIATRSTPSPEGGRRAADRWYPADTQHSDTNDERATTLPTIPEPAHTAAPPTDAQASDRPVRLARGELRALVLAELRRDPDTPMTPGMIARRLGRSAGAVSNALDTLTGQGQAVRVGDAPRTFLAAPADDAQDGRTGG